MRTKIQSILNIKQYLIKHFLKKLKSVLSLTLLTKFAT